MTDKSIDLLKPFWLRMLTGMFMCLGNLQVQEYVEAATFYKFCLSGTLVTLDEINETLLPLSDPSLEPLQINILDYLLGVCGLSWFVVYLLTVVLLFVFLNCG